MIYDVAILGAGPAGATLARLIGKQKNTLVVDKKDGDNGGFSKPCGGLLSPDAQKSLSHFDLTLPKSVLVDPQIFAVKTIDLQSGISCYYQRFYINLDRQKFDNWLISLIPAQVTFYQGRGLEIKKKHDIFEITCINKAGERTVFETKCLIGADGANSLVRRIFYPKKRIGHYVAIQQWFKDTRAKPLYSCIFDPQTSDCCSWTISKEGYTIFGGVFSPHKCRERFEAQKRCLEKFDFQLQSPQKTEACLVLRPRALGDLCLGGDGVYLIGEAAGLISPSSLEGISWAIDSASCLATALLSDSEKVVHSYYHSIRPLRRKLSLKIFKARVIYQPLLRKWLMRSGIKHISVVEEK